MKPLNQRWLRAGATWLVLCVGPAALARQASSPAAAPDPATKLATIEQEFEQEQKAFYADLKAAASDEDAQHLYEGFAQDVVSAYAKRYEALALESRGTETSFKAWRKVFDLGSMYHNAEALRKALDALMAEHAQREELADLTLGLRYGAQQIGEERVIGALRTLAERSPHRKVKASALYNLGATLGENRPAGDPQLAEARAILCSVAKDYAEVELYPGRTCGQAAEAFLFELDHLQVGMPAPEFAAVDAEGASFRLSDYKGKVVLIDFWGFW